MDIESPIYYLEALEKELSRATTKGEVEVVFRFDVISKAFPGAPHPNYFERSLIDQSKAQLWANERNWVISFAHDKHEDPADKLPPVRFERRA